MVAKMFVLRVWYVYYKVQCGDAACAGAGNEMIINDDGWGYGEKRSDDTVEGGVGVLVGLLSPRCWRGWGFSGSRPGVAKGRGWRGRDRLK